MNMYFITIKFESRKFLPITLHYNNSTIHCQIYLNHFYQLYVGLICEEESSTLKLCKNSMNLDVAMPDIPQSDKQFSIVCIVLITDKCCSCFMLFL